MKIRNEIAKKYLAEVLLLQTAYTIRIILQPYCYLSARSHEDSEFVQYTVEVIGRMRLPQSTKIFKFD